VSWGSKGAETYVLEGLDDISQPRRLFETIQRFYRPSKKLKPFQVRANFCFISQPQISGRPGASTMSICVVTDEIFDAFLKCESKAYFKSSGRIGEPDELVN